jgi:hypothetical protein
MFPQYQKPAPLRQGEWNHIKLVVSGLRMNVFINGTKAPSLKIGNLEGDSLDGGLQISCCHPPDDGHILTVIMSDANVSFYERS